MKDYSSYHTSYKDNLNHSASAILDIQLNGAEGYDSIIDGVPYRIIVQDHTNPMNEYREDRKVICDVSVSIHRGSIIEIGAEKYIVITEVDSNNYYKSAKMTRTNNSLKWKNDLGIIIETPCIAANATLYSLGVEETKLITVPDGKLAITISNNVITQEIGRDFRFVLNHKFVYKVTFVDTITLKGIVNLILAEDDVLPQDDLENNIAYNGEVQTEQTPIVSGYVIGGNSTIQLNEIQTYAITQNGSPVTNRTFTWNETTIDGLTTNLITVLSSTGTEFTIQANNSYKYGKVKLTAICNEDINLKLEKVVQIASML